MKLKIAQQQHFSCILCGRCCRRHNVQVTPEEAARLNQLKFDTISAPFTEKLNGENYLRAQQNGDCIFLDQDSHCILHQKYGAAIKALSCRGFPLNIIQTFPDEVRVMACFDCPSVLQQSGKLLKDQQSSIQKLVSEIHFTGGFTTAECQNLNPDTIEKITTATKEILQHPGNDFRTAISAAEKTISKIELLPPAMLNDPKLLDEVLLGLQKNPDTYKNSTSFQSPGSFLRLYFRQWLCSYCRKSSNLSQRNIIFRIHQGIAVALFIFGHGNWHSLGEEHPRFPFAKIRLFKDSINKPWDPEIWESCQRYLQTRLEVLQFFGSAYYGVPFFHGLRALLQSTLAIYAHAKYHAAAEKNWELSRKDVEYGVRAIDFSFGKTPILALAYNRNAERFFADDQFRRLLFTL